MTDTRQSKRACFGASLGISGCPLLSQSFADTFFELSIVHGGKLQICRWNFDFRRYLGLPYSFVEINTSGLNRALQFLLRQLGFLFCCKVTNRIELIYSELLYTVRRLVLRSRLLIHSNANISVRYKQMLPLVN